MKHLEIRNIGSIQELSISINKVNLFIGPQSSGKSTIAKILSFCFWLEKFYVVNQGRVVPDSEFINKKLLSFHNMRQYFRDGSYIKYEGKWIMFEYKSLTDFKIEIMSDLGKAYLGKIAYVPSERNVVSIPSISSLEMDENYIRGFVFDWLQVHRKFTDRKDLKILDLGVHYHYDEYRGDVLTIGDHKEIGLFEASSGLQSVVPLVVYLFYTTKWIYEHEMDLSFEKYSTLQKTLMANFSQEQKGNHLTVEQAMELLSKPHYTKLILEEPEQNLFPQTQYELVKQIVTMMDFGRGDNLVVTTHSPYIMTSFNNLIQAGNALAQGKTKDSIMNVLGSDCALDYQDIGAWVVTNGQLHSLKDDEFQLLSTEALDEASVQIGNDFEKLCDYE